MSYRFIEELTVADVAFEARGKTLEALFTSAGLAVTAVQVKDLETIQEKEIRPFNVISEQIDMLLFNFLQDTIYFKDIEQMLFRSFALAIGQDKEQIYHLSGTGKGETLDPSRHEQLVDVKAVTLHKFEVVQDKQGWKATVVLDI